jgi:hypothetical protein
VPLACRIAYCSVWAEGSSPFCRTHHRRWKTQGRPPTGEFARMCEQDTPAGGEHIDLQRLPAQLKLEIQYALQRRRDEGKARVVPAIAQSLVHALARTEATSLLDWPEESWAKIVPPGTNSRGATTLLLMHAAMSKTSAAVAAGRSNTPATCGGCASWTSTRRNPPSGSTRFPSPG